MCEIVQHHENDNEEM